MINLPSIDDANISGSIRNNNTNNMNDTVIDNDNYYKPYYYSTMQYPPSFNVNLVEKGNKIDNFTIVMSMLLIVFIVFCLGIFHIVVKALNLTKDLIDDVDDYNYNLSKCIKYYNYKYKSNETNNDKNDDKFKL